MLGVGLFVLAMWELAHLNAQSGAAGHVLAADHPGRLASGFLFAPVNYLAVGSLRRRGHSRASGLLSLARQLGGSVGIAILATSLQTYVHANRANLVGDLTPSNPAYNDRLAGLTGALQTHGYSLADARHGALGIMDQILTQQVAAMSYNDTFLLLMAISVAMVPTLLLLRKPKPGAAPVAMH